MTGDDRQRLEQQRDQALRDLVDLDRQVAEGELRPEVAHRLRSGYERAAATALAALSRPDQTSAPLPDGDPGVDPVESADPAAAPAAGGAPSSRARLRPTARWALYGMFLTAAVFAAAVLLPDSLMDRIAGGAVSGNEVLAGSAPGQTTSTPRDLSTVSNAEMEQVVAENPEVVDMRLALAHRYLDGGEYLSAARHYLVALRQEPRNVEALSHYGWLLLQLDDARQGMDYVDRALAQDPQQMEALWFKANIALYGLTDPATAIAVLEQLQQRQDLPTEVRTEVEGLLQQARDGSGNR